MGEGAAGGGRGTLYELITSASQTQTPNTPHCTAVAVKRMYSSAYDAHFSLRFHRPPPGGAAPSTDEAAGVMFNIVDDANFDFVVIRFVTTVERGRRCFFNVKRPAEVLSASSSAMDDIQQRRRRQLRFRRRQVRNDGGTRSVVFCERAYREKRLIEVLSAASSAINSTTLFFITTFATQHDKPEASS